MPGRTFISRFSPNRTDPAVLEAIFVQRHRLAQVWFERLRDSVLTGVKHHLLAVGPRGCGKSHVIALLIGRLRKDPALLEQVRIAWLPEDETTPSFWKLLLRILRALNAEYGDEFPPPPRAQLADVADDRRSALLTDYLLKKLDGRTLLVVVENLDDVMRGLKDEGQKRWRAFLQEHPVAATLATAQQLTEDISDRDQPFFNFFQIEHLQPLTADEALTLLRKVAEHIGNNALAGFLQTPSGCARVRVIRHIAGGSHRIFIILSEYANRENLDELITTFEELLDELTPYYQERLRWLPDQQREIVEFLCRQNRTVPVKEIASALFLSEQTAGAQLKSLRDKGYVIAGSIGRESRYELAEPMMRLCVEVKNPQREPIRLIVDFLRVWYDRAGMQARLRCLSADAEMERRYLCAALESPLPDAIASSVKDTIVENREALNSVLIELVATADSVPRCFAIARDLLDIGEYAEVLVALDRAIELAPTNAYAFDWRGRILHYLGRDAEALVAHERATDLNPANDSTWNNKGVVLADLRRYAEALAAHERAIELNPKSDSAWNNMGNVLGDTGRYREALAAFDKAIELNSKNTYAWINKGYTLNLHSQYTAALQAFDQAIELEPKNAWAWINKAWSLNYLGRHAEALYACDQGSEPTSRDGYVWENRGRANLGLGRFEEAKNDFRHAINVNGNLPGAYEGLAEALVLQGNWTDAEQVISNRFHLPPTPFNPAQSRHLPDLIVAIFRASADAKTWAHRLKRVAGFAQEVRDDWATEKAAEKVTPASALADSAEAVAPPNPLAVLGDALVRSLTRKAYAEARPDALEGWAGVWQQVAARHQELSFATRLFSVGMRYVRIRDERVLLDLVQEERAIVRELFGLDDRTAEG